MKILTTGLSSSSTGAKRSEHHCVAIASQLSYGNATGQALLVGKIPMFGRKA
jgi:hypothetical protein